MSDRGGAGVVPKALARLGGACWRQAWLVVIGWAALTFAAAFASQGLAERLLSGSGDIEGSPSLRVDQAMRKHFARHDDQALLLTIRSAALESRPADFAALLDRLERRIATIPSVAGTLNDGDIGDSRLRPAPGSGHVLLIDLATSNVLASEQQVPVVRAAADDLLGAELRRTPDLKWAVTGRAALTYDINRFSEADSARAELRAIPVTLIILVFAFGSIAAATVPLILALVSRTAALGIVFYLAGPVDMSNLVQSIVTMLSIALGIDYSLFILHRYRRELAVLIADNADEDLAALRERAMRRAMAQSGTAVVYSAVTVAIGMGALLATPLMQTRSIGLGGLLAVIITLSATITLVPAILRLLRPSLLEWPARLGRRLASSRTEQRWNRWADAILRRPLLAALASVVLLAGLAAPALHTRFGFPESEFVPAELEYSRGLAMLDAMEVKGLVAPVLVLVASRDVTPVLSEGRRVALSALIDRLEADRRVRAVIGPLPGSRRSALAAGEQAFEQAATLRLLRAEHSADDGRLILLRVIPSDGTSLVELRNLARELPAMLDLGGVTVSVGGQAQYFNDFDISVADSYPLAIGLVLVMSAIALLLVFRAPLAAAKAIVLNLLSVAAGYGVVVLVFQLGVGSELFGVAEPTEVIPITIPLVMFCVLFGLSMDYEIFLLSRVRTLFADSRDNEASVKGALADTGSVITSAALIMVAVFGAFAFARLIIVQMLGLGLAVAVLIDAVVIRSVLGPALMKLAGRWNWWPALPGPLTR